MKDQGGKGGDDAGLKKKISQLEKMVSLSKIISFW